MYLYTIAAVLLTPKTNSVDDTYYVYDDNSQIVVEPRTILCDTDHDAKSHLTRLIEAADEPTSITDPRLRVVCHPVTNLSRVSSLFK